MIHHLHLVESFNPVHSRHPVVDEQNIKMLTKNIIEAFISAHSRHDLGLGVPKKSLGNNKVCLAVIYYEHPSIRSGKVSADTPLYIITSGQVSHCLVFFGSDKLRNDNGKCRALSVFGINLYLSSHKIHKSLGYVHTKSGSFHRTVQPLVKSDKHFEHLVYLVFFYPDSGVLNRYDQIALFLSHSLKSGTKSNTALPRILKSIRQKICCNLSDP